MKEGKEKGVHMTDIYFALFLLLLILSEDSCILKNIDCINRSFVDDFCHLIFQVNIVSGYQLFF